MEIYLFRYFLFILSCFNSFYAVKAQEVPQSDTLTLIFTGDIMGHLPQIQSAFNSTTGTYDYTDVFSEIKPVLSSADFTIGNLEVTLAGKPYSGYPQFSSPDELAVAVKDAGFDVLLTANNHSCDKGKNGILRTVNVLDSLMFLHTGTFSDEESRAKNNLLVLNKGTLKIGILNYSYGTNGIPIPEPTQVNLIDTVQISKDIEDAKASQLDKLIICLHWGDEYQSQPNSFQTKLTEYLFAKGVDIIIGSHPHVLQRMEFRKKTGEEKGRFVAYSLGNFVSDQRTRKRDGGVVLKLTLVKDTTGTEIIDAGYMLTWVYKPVEENKTKFRIISCSEYLNFGTLPEDDFQKLKIFADDSKSLLDLENINTPELSISKKSED